MNWTGLKPYIGQSSETFISFLFLISLPAGNFLRLTDLWDFIFYGLDMLTGHGVHLGWRGVYFRRVFAAWEDNILL